MNDTRSVLMPKKHSKPIGKYSPGMAVTLSKHSRWVFVSGQVATDLAGNVLWPEDPIRQTQVVFERIDQVLAQAGAGLTDLVSLIIYIVNKRDFASVSLVRNKLLSEPAPTSTLVVVSELIERGCLVEISAIAIVNHEASLP